MERLAAILFLVGLLLLPDDANGQDLTRVPGSSGSSVVNAVLSQLTASRIFLADNSLMRRIACVESRDGLDAATYRRGYHGGIWQLDESRFEETKNTTAHPSLLTKHDMIRREFPDIGEWSRLEWIELRKPLLSALAARLYLSSIVAPIPRSSQVVQQANYWIQHYNIGGTVNHYNDCVNALQATEVCQNVKRGIDLFFVLDSSGSINSTNFRMILNFVSDIVQKFEIGPHATQVGVITFFTRVNLEFSLNTFQTSSSLHRAISRVRYTGGGTNTAAGLELLVQEFKSGGARNISEGIPRVAIVLTDGRSTNSRDTITMARIVHQQNILTFAVGVGEKINVNELHAIASSPQYVYLIASFQVNDLTSLQETLNTETCTAPTIGDPGQTYDENELAEGQIAFFQFPLPEEGMTIKVDVSEGAVVVYGSSRIQQPNEAFHDFKIETSTSADVFISSDMLQTNSQTPPVVKRQAVSSDVSIFVSVEGQNQHNNFSLNTTTGNTSTVVCPPNHFSATGMPPCVPCAESFYQPEPMQTQCIPCNSAKDDPACITDPLEISLVDGSPVVEGMNANFIIETNKPVDTLRCKVSGREFVNCLPGNVTYTGLTPRERNKYYFFRVDAITFRGEKRIAYAKFLPEISGMCSVHLVNKGIDVAGNTARIEYATTGEVNSTECFLDRNQTSFPCTSPFIMGNLTASQHYFKIRPNCPGLRNKFPLGFHFNV